MDKIIIFTGGGSGGHVVPALTLISKLRKRSFEIQYIGSRNGIESKLTQNQVDKYYSISTGKLRRYIDFENVVDIFKILFGCIQSFFILLKIKLKYKKSIVVSMGGFVCVPVVVAARILFMPIIIHEQTSRVGLANKISSIFATKVLVSFSESLKFFPKYKTILTGYPVRDDFYEDKINDVIIESIKINNANKPILLITGGGNGSKLLNDKVKNELPELREHFFIVHQVGQAFIDEFKVLKSEDYLPLAFIGPELPDLFKMANIILSRSGAGTVAELLALGKRSIFIPLKIAQKNEQYHNAMVSNSLLGSQVISEDEFRNIQLSRELKRFQVFNKGVEKNKASELIYNEIISLLER